MKLGEANGSNETWLASDLFSHISLLYNLNRSILAIKHRLLPSAQNGVRNYRKDVQGGLQEAEGKASGPMIQDPSP